MKIQYETASGVAGHIEAANQQQALQILESQYGAGGIAMIDGREPVAASPAKDEHGWDHAFKMAAARG